MSELLPCPFCGCTAIYVTHTHYYEPEDTVSIFCNGCKTHVTLESNEAEGISSETKATAIEAWNTRVERTCHMEQVKTFPGTDCPFLCWVCSACGRQNDVQSPSFCPHCGAKVVGE
jgi:Lar family restriction alleviation protein